jgi:hypothetical protein
MEALKECLRKGNCAVVTVSSANGMKSDKSEVGGSLGRLDVTEWLG